VDFSRTVPLHRLPAADALPQEIPAGGFRVV
jgi:hypothetical protein